MAQKAGQLFDMLISLLLLPVPGLRVVLGEVSENDIADLIGQFGDHQVRRGRAGIAGTEDPPSQKDPLFFPNSAPVGGQGWRQNFCHAMLRRRVTAGCLNSAVHHRLGFISG